MAGNRYLQGYYKPKHPEKYMGDINNIIYRSSLELKVLTWLDSNKNIIKYASEEFWIPYEHPYDKRPNGLPRIARYFPDFFVQGLDKNGKTKHIVIEVKPESQVLKPQKTPRKKEKTFLNEEATWNINMAKWDAATKYCLERGFEFKVLTDKDIKGKLG